MHAEQPELTTVEHSVELIEDLRSEIILDGFHVIAERREHDAMAAGDIEAAEMVLIQFEICRHSTPAIDAAAKRNGHQRARQVVGPLVIRTDELPGRAAVCLAEFGTAMSTSVFEGPHLPGVVPRDNDGSRSDIGTDIV